MATFIYRKGSAECRRFDSAGTMAKDTLCQFNEAGEVLAHATNKDCVGITLEAATSLTEPLVQIINSGDIIEAIGVTPIIVAGTVGDHVDITTGSEITFTDTNKDALVVAWDGVTASRCMLTLKKLAFGSGSTLS